MAPGSGIHLNCPGASPPDTLIVHRRFLVALDHTDRICAAELSNRFANDQTLETLIVLIVIMMLVIMMLVMGCVMRVIVCGVRVLIMRVLMTPVVEGHHTNVVFVATTAGQAHGSTTSSTERTRSYRPATR